jgi:flavin-dependent dehydrogenase
VNTVVQHYGDEVVEIPIRPSGDVDGLYAPRRTVIDRLLVDAARAAGATVLHGTTVTDLVFDGADRVQGVVLGRGGSGVPVRCRFVIGADGARSFVARRVGSELEHRYATSAATAYAYLPGLPDDTYRNYFVQGLAVGIIPTNEGLANVWAGVPMDRFATIARRDVTGFYLDALESVDPRLAAHARRTADLSIRRFAGLRGFTRRAWGPGWALVGDAVYFKDPLSAHGMTDALIGAELVSRAVIDAFIGTDESVAMANYAATRARLARPMMPAIERLAAFRWQPWEVTTDHLELNQAMRDEWLHLVSLPPFDDFELHLILHWD